MRTGLQNVHQMIWSDRPHSRKKGSPRSIKPLKYDHGVAGSYHHRGVAIIQEPRPNVLSYLALP